MNSFFTQQIIQWYARNKRKLPWRDVQDAYRIWLSEIILQQTRIKQGESYYQRFIDTFPNVFSLAKASSQEVYKLWEGLGYYNRAENLMKTAKIIVEKYNGSFPNDFYALRSLPGIGDYTAAAIASFAFHQPYAVVDGNVYRVLSRYFGIKTPIHTSRAKKEFTTLSEKLMNGVPPADFNQALMEFGALYCQPVNPQCSQCIFQNHCIAYLTGKQSFFPVKKKKKPLQKRYYHFFVIQCQQNGKKYLYLHKRTENDIWRNLYDFPSFISYSGIEKSEKNFLPRLHDFFLEKTDFLFGFPSTIYRQQLTHIKIEAVFIPVFFNGECNNLPKNNLSLVQINKINEYPVHRLITRYLQDNKLIK